MLLMEDEERRAWEQQQLDALRRQWEDQEMAEYYERHPHG